MFGILNFWIPYYLKAIVEFAFWEFYIIFIQVMDNFVSFWTVQNITTGPFLSVTCIYVLWQDYVSPSYIILLVYVMCWLVWILVHVQIPYSIKYNGTIQGLKYIWKTEGFCEFCKVNGNNCACIVTNSAVKFFSYEQASKYVSLKPSDVYQLFFSTCVFDGWILKLNLLELWKSFFSRQ